MEKYGGDGVTCFFAAWLCTFFVWLRRLFAATMVVVDVDMSATNKCWAITPGLAIIGARRRRRPECSAAALYGVARLGGGSASGVFSRRERRRLSSAVMTL